MLTWILKLATRKVFQENHWNKLFTEDPYYEEVIIPSQNGIDPPKKIKRKRQIPKGLSAQDAKIFEKIKRRSYHLDMLFSFIGLRFGWNGLLGAIPVIGSGLSVINSILLYRMVFEFSMKLPITIHLQLLANIMVDFLLGFIPIVGDLIEVGYKANSRNALIIEKYLINFGNKTKLNASAAESLNHIDTINSPDPSYLDVFSYLPLVRNRNQKK
ncbi:hypothetical protein PACTADRAFT_84463 [Pachysolen tannophilus NRRL Y-2460]|uniref:DUF4112 domain-containing protein n=1 Tax=Pachysolen tannophilus NRRL Y-2460 TaxID=669874 RepID=A0A1E4TZS9_PACTA|nr:hypothetical protein PACTADRAFT_84463 [Pachysolen tannophilus NRRL Y-2460]